jgi:hypothetical protein
VDPLQKGEESGNKADDSDDIEICELTNSKKMKRT